MVSPGVNRPASYKLVGAILVASTRIKQRGRLTRAPDLVYAGRPLTRVKRDECRFANSCYELPLELA